MKPSYQHEPDSDADPIAFADDFAREQIKELGAASCTFYVRDPFWRKELRLLLMPGVRLREPMYGFLYPADARRVIALGQVEEFTTVVSRSPELFGRSTIREDITERDAHRLFGNFVQRENVVSCARLQCFDNDELPRAVLFVNYQQMQVFDGDTKERIRNFMRGLETLLPGIYDSLLKRGTKLAVLPTILDPIRSLAALGLRQNDLAVDRYLVTILEAALDAFGIPKERGCGTAHLFNPETEELTLRGATSKIPGVPIKLSVTDRKGVIAWVAHRKRGILIRDRSTSEFSGIYVKSELDFSSELAVPLLVGDDFLGVLNLEAKDKNAFQEDDVRLFWYAANAAAIALRINREIEEHRVLLRQAGNLLHICHDASIEPDTDSKQLDSVAQNICETLKAEACEMWVQDEKSGRFVFSGSSRPTDSPVPSPRKRGWTQYVLDNDVPLYISNISGKRNYKWFTWDRIAAKWNVGQKGGDSSPSLNRRIDIRTSRGILGIPIPIRDTIVGVIWIVFARRSTAIPSLQVKLATGIASQAGMVVDYLRRKDEIAQAQAEQGIKKSIQDRLFRSGYIESDLSGRLQGYFLAQPCKAYLGGDFHASWSIDAETSGFLLGDAQGHGGKGAFYMLPMIATCRACYADSRSTQPLIDKLLNVCDALEIQGTAAYLVLRMVGRRLFAYTTTAGHHPFIVLRAQGASMEQFPKENSPARCVMLGVRKQWSFSEERIELEAGDLIVGFTDGVVDAGETEQPFGVSGITSVVMKNAERNVEEIAKAVYEEVARHCGGDFSDDATIMVVKVLATYHRPDIMRKVLSAT